MSNNKTGNMICAGAICQCKFGKAPAKLKVLTQNKHYINDAKAAQKLLATNKEIGQPFNPPFFGSCAQVNNGPCAVAITNWANYYDGIKIENGGMPLLEGSKATCAIGGKDCISIIWHGQAAQPSAANAKNTNKNILAQINPLVNIEEIPDDTDEKEIQLIANNKFDDYKQAEGTINLF